MSEIVIRRMQCTAERAAAWSRELIENPESTPLLRPERRRPDGDVLLFSGSLNGATEHEVLASELVDRPKGEWQRSSYLSFVDVAVDLDALPPLARWLAEAAVQPRYSSQFAQVTVVDSLTVGEAQRWTPRHYEVYGADEGNRPYTHTLTWGRLDDDQSGESFYLSAARGLALGSAAALLARDGRRYEITDADRAWATAQPARGRR